jgi:hypothetical protein
MAWRARIQPWNSPATNIPSSPPESSTSFAFSWQPAMKASYRAAARSGSDSTNRARSPATSSRSETKAKPARSETKRPGSRAASIAP